MTREEAITRLHWLKRELIKGTDMNEPIDMAIEALHREEAEAKGYCHRIKPKEYLKNDAMQKLREMPRCLNGVKEKQITKISADAVHSDGVFVPNMEIPKACDYCLFHDSNWSWCKAKNKYCGDGKCPLIAVRGERKEP